ncbi:MAG TPA: SDR family oxidoreductase [Acidimicrobiia bacterium]|nr:SDR family oxidoreductase [Acidimicrobiia bacterium]
MPRGARLVGRRALVVGASGGIGRAMGIALAREGASVAFAARTRSKLDAAVAACEGDVMAVECDVRDPASCGEVVAATAEAFGGLDVLVYSAGRGAFRELAHASADDWRSVLDTNVVGAALVTAAAVEHLKASGGHAVYLSSESALHHTPWRGIGIYVASKRALDSMVRSFALEVPEVHFTTYVVGSTGGTDFIAPDQMDEITPFLAEWYEQGLVVGMLEPETHAKALVDLLTTDGWVQTISVRVRGSR